MLIMPVELKYLMQRRGSYDNFWRVLEILYIINEILRMHIVLFQVHWRIKWRNMQDRLYWSIM